MRSYMNSNFSPLHVASLSFALILNFLYNRYTSSFYVATLQCIFSFFLISQFLSNQQILAVVWTILIYLIYQGCFASVGSICDYDKLKCVWMIFFLFLLAFSFNLFNAQVCSSIQILIVSLFYAFYLASLFSHLNYL